MSPRAVSWLTEIDTGIALTLRVVPRAGRDEVAGLHGDTLRIRVSAPAVEGAANRSVVAFLARILDVRRQQITIQSGTRSRRKRVHIAGIGKTAALQRLRPLLE
jgi:uncharacterized protein (TIGR00251 family)